MLNVLLFVMLNVLLFVMLNVLLFAALILHYILFLRLGVLSVYAWHHLEDCIFIHTIIFTEYYFFCRVGYMHRTIRIR